jgi:hypothetical protein
LVINIDFILDKLKLMASEALYRSERTENLPLGGFLPLKAVPPIEI